jgi:D-alanyl-D-alanine carboxypeptidase
VRIEGFEGVNWPWEALSTFVAGAQPMAIPAVFPGGVVRSRVTANPEGTPVAVDHTFRIASVTKTYTAAAILRLYEQAALGLDDPIARHLPAEYVTLLRSDGYDPDVITIAMLLRHTSGIYDYAFGPGSPFLGTVFADPAHRWTPLEQVRFAVEHGQPIATPGTVFHYSDPGYVLLGQIVEVATGQPLGASFRSLLSFDRLGIAHTWLESIDPEPAGVGPRIHQYIQATDATGFDPSIDLFGSPSRTRDVMTARCLSTDYRFVAVTSHVCPTNRTAPSTI